MEPRGVLVRTSAIRSAVSAANGRWWGAKLKYLYWARRTTKARRLLNIISLLAPTLAV